MIKTTKRMAEVTKDIAEKVEANEAMTIDIVEGQVDNTSYEVESPRGYGKPLTARHKNRDRRNLGKEKSARMHWQAACKIDRTASQKDRRKKNKEAKKNAKVS